MLAARLAALCSVLVGCGGATVAGANRPSSADSLAEVVSTSRAAEPLAQQAEELAAAPAPDARDERARLEFERLDVQPGELESIAISASATGSTADYIDQIVLSIHAAATTTQSLAMRLERVVALRSARWTVAAFVRQGEIYARLVDALRFGMPPPPAILLQGSPDFAERVRAAMEPQLRPVLCLAVVRWVLAVRAGRAGMLDTDATRAAAGYLAREAPEVIAQCVAEQHAEPSPDEVHTLVRCPGDGPDVSVRRARRGCRMVVEWLDPRADVHT